MKTGENLTLKEIKHQLSCLKAAEKRLIEEKTRIEAAIRSLSNQSLHLKKQQQSLELDQYDIQRKKK